MKIIITMAGDGTRFSTAGYDTIKPLIQIKNKTILEWTTQSLPFIKHYGLSKVNKDYDLGFAIRSEHDKTHDLSNKLKKIYGDDIKIKIFDKLTRGNLETAYLSIKELFGDSDEELLILDADNHYNGDRFLFYRTLCKEAAKGSDFGAVCYFYPKDDDPKWCFAKIDKKNKVISLHEKNKVPGSYPMVGVFYYNKISLFLRLAEEILESNITVKKEFYTSQSFQKLLEKNIPVYGIMVTDVCPLGTPEDVIEYGKFLIQTEKDKKEIDDARADKTIRY